MAALRVHQHRVDREGIALPFVPKPFRAARHIDRIRALQHQRLRSRSASAPAPKARGSLARLRQLRPRMRKAPSGERSSRAQSAAATKASSRRRRSAKGSARRSSPSSRRQIIGADMRREIGEKLGRDRLAIEPLLQHAERLDAAVAHDQQFAVEREGLDRQLREAFGKIGKGRRNIFAGAGIEPQGDAPVALAAARRPGRGCRPISIPRRNRRGRARRNPSARWRGRAWPDRMARGPTRSGRSSRPSSQANRSR